MANNTESQFCTVPFRRAKPKEIPTNYIYITNCGNDLSAIHEVVERFGIIRQYNWSDARKAACIFYFQEKEDALSVVTALNGKNCDFLENRKLHIEFTIPRTLESSAEPAVNSLIVMQHSGYVEHIPGLYIAVEFISEKDEEELISHLESMDWRDQIGRRVLHFGYRFNYKTRHVDIPQTDGIPDVSSVQLISHKLQTEHVQEALAVPPSIPEYCTDLLDKFHALISSLESVSVPAEGHLVDQITVNEYLPGQGIASHIDTHSAFHDYIASLSLESQVIMDFQIPKAYLDGSYKNNNGVGEEETEKAETVKYSVLLPRRSLVLMTGESRYCWSHGIAYRVHDKIDGKVVKRSKRLSLTLRRVRFSRKCDCSYPYFCDTNK